MTKHIKINLNRLEYLQELYDVSESVILDSLNKDRKNKIDASIFNTNRIRLSLLKKIDKEFFKKDISFYTDPRDLSHSKNASIFFRKEIFNSELEHADRLRINDIEAKLQYLNGIMEASRYKLPERKLQFYNIDDNPQKAANEVRAYFDWDVLRDKSKSDRDYLRSLIEAYADLGILVHEFVEAHNLKKKVSWDGMFLAPNVITIKRQQNALNREIFTLAHELGHYLVNSEEVDKNPLEQVEQEPLKQIESWCNAFAFHFLLGQELISQLPSLFSKNPTIKNPEISKISNEYHLSRLAIYTHLFRNNDIKWADYAHLRDDLKREYEHKQNERKRQREIDKAQNPGKVGGAMPQPIHSNLEKSIYHHAFFEGTIGEIDIINRFKPKQNEIEKGFIDKFLYGEVI